MSMRWGIVGTGTHAENFMAPALLSRPETKLMAVCDVEEKKAEEFAQRHGIEQRYISFEEMLKNPDLDVVWIATPNHLHARQTIQAAEAGKHILCEKPMALSIADAEAMIEACEKNGVHLGIDFQNRFHPAHREVYRLIRTGAVGDIAAARAQFCRGFHRGFMKGWRVDPASAGAGALMGQGLHPIDLLRFLLGSEVVEVSAFSDEKPPHRPVEDMAYIMLRFENGVRAMVMCGILAPRPDNDAVIYGTDAKVICKGTVGMWLSGELVVEGNALNVNMNFPNEDESGPALYERVVDHFNLCIESDAESDISGQNGLKMVKIACAVIESSRKGKSVRL